MRRAVAALAVVGVALALSTSALAGPAIMVVLTPDPAFPGQTVTISFTGGFTQQCAQFGGGNVSNITLTPTGGGSSVGPIVFNGNPGTFTLPADTPLGDYTAQVNCSYASDSSITRSTTLTVIAEPPTTTTTSPAASSIAPAAVLAAPSLTG